MAMGTASPTGFIHNFLIWWGGELRALMPMAALRQRRSKPDTVLDLAGNEPTIRSRRRGRISGKAAIALSRDDILEQTIALPATARRTLHQILRFEVEGRTPYRAVAALYDFRILDTPPDDDRLHLAFIVVGRDVVQRAEATAATLGIVPRGFGYYAGDQFMPLELVSPTEAPDAKSGSRITGWLIGLCAVLSVAIAVAAVERRASRAEALDQAVARATEAARDARAVQERYEARLIRYDDIVARKANGSPTAVLLELTQALPDRVWLYVFALDRHEVRLRGYAPSAPAVLEQLEALGRFEDVRFQGPVVQDDRSGLDRFEIHVSLSQAFLQ